MFISIPSYDSKSFMATLTAAETATASAWRIQDFAVPAYPGCTSGNCAKIHRGLLAFASLVADSERRPLVLAFC